MALAILTKILFRFDLKVAKLQIRSVLIKTQGMDGQECLEGLEGR